MKRNLGSNSYFKCYALAVDEAMDDTDTAQIAIYFREIGSKYNVTEEIDSLVPLKDKMKSLYLYETIKTMVRLR